MLTSQAGFAQTGTNATITGTVTDPSGAVVTGVTVTVKNMDTGIARAGITLDSGNYVVPELKPGKYSLTIEQQGFKPYEQQNIILVIGQRATINVSLQVGSEQQRITVTASDVPVVQTEDSSIGLVVEAQTIVNTPLNGRLSVMGLMALAPGVQNAGTQDQMPVYGVTPSIGTGSRNSYGGVGYTLDGALNMMVSLERGSGEVPPLDGIAEFKFLTSDVPAQFNQPAQVVVVSKGGANQFHGMLLEFNRVAATSAKEYFNNGKMPKYIRNEYGANFSGPITIPHLYNGHDRSFFFFNWENFNLHQADSINSQEPTTKMRAGDFSEFAVATTTGIIDPSTGTNYGTSIAGHINSVSLALQKVLFPATTTSGTGTNTYENVPYVSKAQRISFRLDHKISEKDSIRGTFLRAFYGPNPSTGNNSLEGGMSGVGEHLTNTIVGWSHIFTPTLLADTTISYFHIPIYRTPQMVNTDFSSIIPGLGTELIQGAPQISISNIVNVSEAGSKDLSQDEQLNASVTKILSRHTIKAGFGVIYDSHWNDSATSPQRGSYTFNAQYTGIGYADFLLGYPSATAKTSPNNMISRNQMAQYDAYVQDDWKLSPKFTINFGIRYDVQKFRPSIYGNDSLYVPGLQKVVVFEDSYNSASSVVPAIDSAISTFPIELASAANMKASLWDYLGQDTNNFAPRLGFAYNILAKTVVRGAYGIYFNLLPGSYVVTNAAGNIPYQLAYTYSQPTWSSTTRTTAPTFSMSNPFSATGTFSSNPGANAQHATVTPYTESYNLAIEREMARGLSVRIGYVGQHNVKQNNYGGSGNTAPDINYPTTITNTAVQARRPVQPWGSIPLYVDPIFHSMENALQVGVHKQYITGLSINGEYSYTRVLGNENFQSNYNTSDSKGNIGGITPHVLVVSYSYLLPFGQGKTFLGNANNAVNKFVAGWQISGITTLRSGQPFSATYSCSGTGCVSGRANRVAGVDLYPAKKTKSQWFNPAAFTAPTGLISGVATKGYAYGNSGYNMLWGPHYQNWDMNLQKTVRWADKVELQLRMDAFNVFNHASFSTPASAISNTSTVGTITSTTSYSRKVEFGAKLTF